MSHNWRIGGELHKFLRSHVKSKPKFSVQALLVLALLTLICVSLVSPWLLRLKLVPVLCPPAEHEDLYDWNLRTTIELKRQPQSRELKAEQEIIGTHQLVAAGSEHLIQDMLQPHLNPTESTLGKSQNSHPTEESHVDGGATYIHSKDTHNHEKLANSDVGKQGRQVLPLPQYRKGIKLRGLRKAVNLAWKAGRKAWRELESLSNNTNFLPHSDEKRDTPCPKSIFMEEQEIEEAHHFMKFPCGLTVGSSITVIGMPRLPHYEYKPSIGHIGDAGSVFNEVSQFMFELHGPKESKNEESSRILHINPRLKGDWSDKPVIELNSFLTGQWGKGQRCDGSRSKYHETVDGLPKCEKWSQGGRDGNEPSWWLHRLIERMEKPELRWPYPFAQNRSFILTVRAGLEGYHMSVDGKHVTSFPYTTGILEENTASSFVGGDVDLQAVLATSLPSVPPKTLNEQIFENWQLWRAPKLPGGSINLFIGVLSASNHFAERMAMRSSWFQTEPIQSAKVVARFFVAMHPDRDVNLKMMKEAEYYGDMVILPFMDDYDLVVLKTLAICEYGVRNLSTNYIMKCDDDTFIRVDAVLNELKMVSQAENLYMGNLNMFHRPLRTGKWAVTFDEWPDEEYPTYANGPGYIISRTIARFIVTQNRKKALELFKMEDVSMGLWVKQYQHASESVQYVNIWKFYQAGCEDGYIIAHYQSPRQMLCMWKKLLKGELHCCN